MSDVRLSLERRLRESERDTKTIYIERMGNGKKKKETVGVSYPMTSSNGVRSTTVTGKKLLTTALESVKSDVSNKTRAAIQKEKNWRFGYCKHIENVVQAMTNSNEDCLKIAKAGLEEARKCFTYRSKDGEERSLEKVVGKIDQVLSNIRTREIYTGIVEGSKRFQGKGQLPEVSYQGKVYTGRQLVSLARMFVAESQADATFARSVEEAVAHPEWFDLRGKVFVLIGATSEMGPLDILLQCGATVVAIARKNSRSKPDKWKNLLARVRDTPGKLLIPISRPQTESDDADSLAQIAGADAISETPDIVKWLTGNDVTKYVGKDSSLHIYCGIYLDGEAFVRASVAMDVIVSGCVYYSGRNKPTLIYIDTPSHVHYVPPKVQENSKDYRKKAPRGLRMLANLGLAKSPRFLSTSSSDWEILDGLSTQQGPNYAIAKLLQRWRALYSRAQGCRVSITTGPPAKTDSVMHSKTMAFVMNHAHEVQPNTAHMPETVQSLMSIIMIRDCHSDKALGARNTIDEDTSSSKHIMEFIVENAWHGGMWCAPYDMKSAAVYLYLKHYCPSFLISLAALSVAVLLFFLNK